MISVLACRHSDGSLDLPGPNLKSPVLSRGSFAALGVMVFLSSAFARDREEPKVIAKVTPLPVALNKDFQFRKTKLYFLNPTFVRHGGPSTVSAGGKQGGVAPSSRTATQQDAS